MKRKKQSIGSKLEQLDSMKDVAIDYAEIPPTTREFWADATLIVPEKMPVSVRLDRDVVEWFKKQGPRYQTRINAALRAFVDHQKKMAR
ncbi:MAG TPA: BrnA antitoxin family protein [Gammaproteobacteria bacterium]|nr:BrnA antitoxin family protein [Gammaproteobacteria bacterium]